MRQKQQVLRRILFEITIPAVCGIVWGGLALHQGKTLFESFSTGFAAFFFSFFLQGQVLRVNKNVRDEMNADQFRENFVSIHEGLKELKNRRRRCRLRRPGKKRSVFPTSSWRKEAWMLTHMTAMCCLPSHSSWRQIALFRRGALYPAMLVAPA
jgi:hypothetical protein